MPSEDEEPMRLKWVMLLLGAVCVAGHAYAGDPHVLKTPKDKVNYSIGVSTIRHFKQYGNDGDIDLEMVMQGMKDELAGKQLRMSEKEIRSVLTAVQTEIMQRKRTAKALASMPGSTAPDGTKKTKP